ncbi:murein DD-endopeptidase MepM/ murein hydrolase activator NlpD [Bradyrhizobium embrapense]
MMLPPIDGRNGHVTGRSGDFGAGRAEGRVKPPSSDPHIGVDMNYLGGQTGINLQHPLVHSPVSGVVTRAGGGKTNTIAIRDYNGNSHEILHTQSQIVKEGQKVFAGDLIGKMGNVGTKDQHAHYQIYGPDDPRRQNPINPHVFWNHPFFPDQERFVPRSPSLVPLESPIPDPTYNYLNPAPSESDAVRGFGTGGRFMQGSATSSRPLYETQSFVAPPDDPSQNRPTSKHLSGASCACRRRVRAKLLSTGERLLCRSFRRLRFGRWVGPRHSTNASGLSRARRRLRSGR